MKFVYSFKLLLLAAVKADTYYGNGCINANIQVSNSMLDIGSDSFASNWLSQHNGHASDSGIYYNYDEQATTWDENLTGSPVCTRYSRQLTVGSNMVGHWQSVTGRSASDVKSFVGSLVQQLLQKSQDKSSEDMYGLNARQTGKDSYQCVQPQIFLGTKHQIPAGVSIALYDRCNGGAEVGNYDITFSSHQNGMGNCPAIVGGIAAADLILGMGGALGPLAGVIGLVCN
ncbi:hypothetical protein HDV06_004237 [Boothiomyces sp. JEL0866]|nr:hypothetical protein HDV06_004237 [Boothiomyces sp. JEL0866]